MLGWTRQNTTFDVLQAGPECGQFQSGTRSQPGFEIFFETPLNASPSLWFLARAGFSVTTLELLSNETTREVRQNGESFDIVRRYTYNAPATGFKLGIGASWEIIKGLRVQATPTATFFSWGEERVTAEIVAPFGVEFSETGEDTRPVTEGAASVEFRPIRFGADLGISERLPIGKRLALHPEVRASIDFGSVARNVNWTEVGFQVLLGVSYDFATHREPPPIAYDPPPRRRDVKPRPELPQLSAEITAYGQDKDGQLYENPVIEIEEAPWVESVPIIPSIFFDSASATIPPRYVQLHNPESASRFRVDSLLGVTPLDIHWQLMNVIGERMRANPARRITITGTVSGDETTGNADALGTARAYAVASYLIDIWHIEPERITVRFDPHLSTASPEGAQEGREENRRAEIRFNDEEIARPVIIRRLATIASPPAVHFFPKIRAQAPVKDWYVTVVQGDKELLRFEGEGKDSSVRQEKQWSLGDLRVTRDLTPIRYRLIVHDSVGQEASDEGEFKVVEIVRRKEEEKARTEVAEYRIVGFNYSSAELLPRHMAQLQDIAKEIGDDAEVTITGYTDRLGDADRNRQLSLDRARAVQGALKTIRQSAGGGASQPVTVHGLGNEQEVFNNDLPEGRLLSRMVQITIMRKMDR
jgi:outer membrane protein OmpA-like peptidoglycan-associated protein